MYFVDFEKASCCVPRGIIIRNSACKILYKYAHLLLTRKPSENQGPEGTLTPANSALPKASFPLKLDLLAVFTATVFLSYHTGGRGVLRYSYSYLGYEKSP